MAHSSHPPCHQPVLAAEAIGVLTPRQGGIYVDGTFGGGGYSRRLLAVAGTRVIAIDRDQEAVAGGDHLRSDYPHRLALVVGCFSRMPELLARLGVAEVDGVVLDLGVSSMQLDNPERGFSFLQDGPLDMRMAREGLSAADWINDCPGEELHHVIAEYGEEPCASRIVRAILAARRERVITTTGELATIVRSAVRSHKSRQRMKIDPATRTFQALRIRINDELGALDGGLHSAERILVPGGRLAVVSFHSLEDRRVKGFLRRRAGLWPRPSRHHPLSAENGGRQPTASFRLRERRAIRPGEAELSRNRRARSARLRWGERTAAPPWPGADHPVRSLGEHAS